MESIVLPQERIVQNLRDQLSQQREELEFDEARLIEYTRNANKLNKHLDELEQEKVSISILCPAFYLTRWLVTSTP